MVSNYREKESNQNQNNWLIGYEEYEKSKTVMYLYVPKVCEKLKYLSD